MDRMINLAWKNMKKQMKKNVKIEKDENKKTVTIKIKGDVKKNETVNKMVGNEEGLKQTLTQFVGKGSPVECNVRFIEAENTIVLENFQDKNVVNEVHKFFSDMFFGDFLKKLMDPMMEAFKGLGDSLK